MKKVILSSVFSMLLLSCSTPDPAKSDAIHVVTVHNSGGSPECFVSHNGVVTKYATSYVITQAEAGDVITALGQSYSIDNSQNYGAPDVNVIANISIFVDGVEVKNGINHATYMVK